MSFHHIHRRGRPADGQPEGGRPADGLLPDGRTGWRTGVSAAIPTATGLAFDTLVATRSGPVPAGGLRPGDAILTRDNGYRPLIWAGHGRRGATGGALRRTVAIAPGTLGAGVPARRLRLASGHGLLVDASALLPLLGTCEALAPAASRGRLLRARPPGGFVQILLETHELILAEGAWVESLSPEAALRVFPRRAAALADPPEERPLRPWLLPAGAALPAPARPLRVA